MAQDLALALAQALALTLSLAISLALTLRLWDSETLTLILRFSSQTLLMSSCRYFCVYSLCRKDGCDREADLSKGS